MFADTPAFPRYYGGKPPGQAQKSFTRYFVCAAQPLATKYETMYLFYNVIGHFNIIFEILHAAYIFFLLSENDFRRHCRWVFRTAMLRCLYNPVYTPEFGVFVCVCGV